MVENWHKIFDITEQQSRALNMVLSKYQHRPWTPDDDDIPGVIADVLIALEDPELWLKDQ